MDDFLDPATLPDPRERYELGERLGSGVFGQVHEATDSQAAGKKVAVKIQTMTPDSEKSILEEYRILKDFCSHANLIDFYGVYCDKSGPLDTIWFVLEYCECGAAIDLVRGLQNLDRKMKEEHIAFILKETIKALTYLHEQNVIHRDVRASNILLNRDGDVKLTDFGLSCRLATNMGKRNSVIGSPSWMAPEVVSGGDSEYGNRADVWALGITAIELADGKAPFEDMHPTRALFQIVRNPPPGLQRPTNWSNDLNDFITECLEKNPEHRPFCEELIEHPFITSLPENDYHLTQELKMLANEVGESGRTSRLPERLIRGGLLQTEARPEPEAMHVEDLAALETLTEDSILEELQVKMARGSFQSFVGDVLLILNPSSNIDIYGDAYHAKYRYKSRSDNEPHVFAVADSAYQDALHHNEPQHIVFSGESRSGKTTNMLHTLRHLAFLGNNQNITGQRIEKAVEILHAATNAGTPINEDSTRCILQTQMTFSKSGKLSGAIFSLYQLEKWRVSTTDMTQANFDLIYYFYDGMEAAGKLADYNLEPERKYRYLRILDTPPKLPSKREDPEGNVTKFLQIVQYLKDLEFDEEEIDSVWKILAALLILGNVRFKDSVSGAAEVENTEEASKITTLLGLDESKFMWALINYCLVEKGTAVKRRHTTDEARDARDVLAGTIYKRLLDWIVNSINLKLSFSRSVFGDKFSINLLDMFGFECFHRNRLEQLIINTMNEQMQFLYNQRVFAWEMQEQEEEQVPVVTLHYYDNKAAVDQLMGRPLGLFYILDEACRTNGGQEYIMSTIKNSSKGPYVKLSGSHEFSVAHYTGKINYDARDLAEKNRDFLPPEMIQTLRASSDQTVRHLFTNKLTKSGSLTAPSSMIKQANEAKERDADHQTKKYNTESKGQYSQVHRMRTASCIFRATSLEVLRALAAGTGCGGAHFVRCVRASLEHNAALAFQPEVVRQQIRALAVLDTARARQQGFSVRIPFAEFIRRYKFLAFDFDENVDITKDNCRLLLIRLKMEGWVIGKTKVFLKYYNVEYLSRLYEVQVKKIVKVQSMMRAFLARRRMEISKSVKAATEQQRPKDKKDMSEEDAAIKIQTAFRGYTVRKAYGPLINKTTGNIDEGTAEFLRRFAAKWRSRTIFQVLLQYRAVRYQDLVNFSQQVHLYNQAMMESLMNTSACVILDRIDPQARPLEFLGPSQPSVWKLPFRILELPYFDTTYMCDPSAKCSDTMPLGYDSDPETWDEPLRRRNHPASHQIRSSLQNIQIERPTSPSTWMDVSPASDESSLIHLPYIRDPSQLPKILPKIETTYEKRVKNTAPTYNTQGYGCIQQEAWLDNEAASRTPVYKKKHAPPTPSRVTPINTRYPTPAPRSTVINNNCMETDDDWQFPKLIIPKTDKNRNTYGGVMPNDMNNPIRELQQLARAKSSDSLKGDDPPFNFQAMLRKTPRNRASMKRMGESPISVPIGSYSPVPLPSYMDNSKPPTPDIHSRGKGKAPPRPKSCQDFKRKDSVERFKMAVKRTDSSQSFKSCLLNGNGGETVQLAPGITVEGYVFDL